MAQCRVFSEIFIVGEGSIKVIESGTIGQIGYGFLLLFYSNSVHKTRRF